MLSVSVPGTPMAHPYDALTPDTVVDCVETLGLRCDLRLIALNSYENRVYQVGIEDDVPVIAKFYRAGRWRDEQIDEELNPIDLYLKTFIDYDYDSMYFF